MNDEAFLVTGASGCIGAWTVNLLQAEGVRTVALDVSDDRRRLGLLTDDADPPGVSFARGDITELGAVEAIIRAEGVTHVVHLAALQVPFCRADPVLGAQVNVVGTVNILEAVRRSEGRVRGLSYASSVAVFGPPEQYPDATATDDAPPHPATLYGVYKQANEATAGIYAADYGVGSVGLRPCIVYGPGRDQGLTSDPSKAMLAAAAGLPAHIGFGGRSTFQYAPDVARVFVEAARAAPEGALVLNVGGPSATVAEVVSAIEKVAPTAAGAITIDEQQLPFPDRYDDSGLDTLLGGVPYRSMEAGVEETVHRFRDLLGRGLLSPPGG
ncbi:MAG: NAD-dependent epimerase/dehydratase family protein [Acidimicrobiia bacterium]